VVRLVCAERHGHHGSWPCRSRHDLGESIEDDVEHAINALPPRLVWINGPYGVGKMTLAIFLRDRWGAVVFDADALGLALQEGLPTEHQVDDFTDLVVWRSSVVGVGCELARAYGPLVAMPMTAHEPDAVIAILEGFRRAGIDDLAKRWCLERLRPVVTSLRLLGGDVRIDTSHQPPDRLASALAGELGRHGWLSETGTWTSHRTGR
jgi:hypothetical protein